MEADLVTRLTGLGYARVAIPDADALRANLKVQLQRHNGVTLTDAEFARVLNHLDKGNVFDKAKILRDRMQLTRDDGSSLYLQFLDTEEWCRNEYQVTRQITVEGSYTNRYDVTLLVNGLPLVQIELKRRGMELKEAFNQIDRYQKHSFWSENGLFNYVQIFVISNGVNTKYFANTPHRVDFKQTFYWAGEDNTPITRLDAFADTFLEKCHVSKMIGKYIVLHESDKLLMVLRPYQYHAVEAILERVKAGRRNGYIWHTTGSGKTLTSFKAAQVLLDLPKVHKVVFVVDRADLNHQTTREFNHFSEGSVDGTDNTRALVDQLAGDTRLIVTTIQKLNTAISRERHEAKLAGVKDKRVVFIFDECHRSQFGETHRRITQFFGAAQMFGFTGTPILFKNAVGRRTTKDLFVECLHRYVITNAIRDENVLRFSVEYWGRLKRRDGSLIDENVPSINVREFFENPDRIDGIADWIIANHARKTHNRQFTAIFCVGSVDALIAYYETFRRKREAGEHNLRIATIFTYAANEDSADENGEIGDPDIVAGPDTPVNKHARDRLEAYIGDYNAMYQTSYSTRDGSFYTYYKDIGARIRNREKADARDKDRVDILLVVNMFLTGFDAKKVNTLYVDKNLRYHGLIQAFSRTNRTLSQLKSQGNIVCFRNLKPRTDEAITLFSNEDALEVVLMEPYETYRDQFNDAVDTLLAITPTVDSVTGLESEDDQLRFVKAFRDLIRVRNVLTGFSEFSQDDLNLDAQTFEDFKSKYLDIHERTKTRKQDEGGASIIDEVDFELELIQRDDINVAYILSLLAQIEDDERSLDPGVRDGSADRRKAVMDLLRSEAQLRSKRDLIERFIGEHMPRRAPGASVQEAFADFWSHEKESALDAICNEEGLDRNKFRRMIESFHFDGKEPLRETVVAALDTKPKVVQRKKIVERVIGRLASFVQTFDDAMGDI